MRGTLVATLRVAILTSALLLTACDNHRVHELYTGAEGQAVTVQANDTVIVTHIDAMEQETAFIGQKHTYRLPPGKHTLLVEYAAMFQLDADRHEKVTSPPIKVTFDAEPGKSYLFRHAEQNSVEAAKAFAKAPKLELVTLPDNAPVAAVFEQSLPMSFLPKIRFQNTESYGFASDRLEHALPAGQAPAARPATTPSEAPPVLDTMKALWQKASPDQRAAFQDWIKTQ